ncbi:unnamed protein product [Sphagnum jensenii]|uniref:Eukaryotic translation initiation factor 3 subunit A n=1 Tax=Sphagnum jensenii TaxID=128206 RepID=A0ABP0VHU3_9BRYO
MQSARAHFEQSLLADQLMCYQEHVNSVREKAVREHRERKVATARRRLYEEQERLREEEELERERKEKEERERLEFEHYERSRRQREQEEAAEKAREAQERAAKEEERREIELKRAKQVEEAKRLRAAALAPAEEVPPAVEPLKEKEIKFRRQSSRPQPLLKRHGALVRVEVVPQLRLLPLREGSDSWRLHGTGAAPSAAAAPKRDLRRGGGSGGGPARRDTAGFGPDRSRADTGAVFDSRPDARRSSGGPAADSAGAPSSRWQFKSSAGDGKGPPGVPEKKKDAADASQEEKSWRKK